MGAVSKGSEGLKQDIGAKLANLKEELSREDEMTRQQLGQLAANTREQMVQLTDGAKEDSAKKVAILQGSISGLQNALEQNRMAFREAREEQLRNMQSEREARNRQNAEIRADYKREIMKEHQDRMDHVADQRKDVFKSLRGGPTSTGQGASHDPSLQLLTDLISYLVKDRIRGVVLSLRAWTDYLSWIRSIASALLANASHR